MHYGVIQSPGLAGEIPGCDGPCAVLPRQLICSIPLSLVPVVISFRLADEHLEAATRFLPHK